MLLRFGLIAAICGLPCAAAEAVVVNPSNLNGWAIHLTDSSGISGTGTGTGDFVTGPSTPPLGIGSGHLQTPAGGGNQSVQFRNSSWVGTRIDALTSLSYSTYATAWNGQQVPYLTIWLDTNNDNAADDRLWFEPAYSEADAGNGNPNPQPDVALNTWQTWDALDGMWYADSLPGPGSNAKTLATYLLSKPDATIVNDPGALGGIRVASGFASAGNNFNAYIDNFTIGTASQTIVYDFEPAPVPEASAFLFGGLACTAAGLMAARRRRAKPSA